MTLLLVGIVAVILVILVAAFLTFRRGQDDDQDEPGCRWTVRDRVRSAGRDGHWRHGAPGTLSRHGGQTTGSAATTVPSRRMPTGVPGAASAIKAVTAVILPA